MFENEVIVVNRIPHSEYRIIVVHALEYAILSIPFTYDRMEIPDLQRKILNIAKGKIAEGLFQYFCTQNDIPADFKSCETPFYQADHRDFILIGKEWDIKNNFLYHQGIVLNDHHYVDLPALIPNRGNWDQWGKRLIQKSNQTSATGFVFTYLNHKDNPDSASLVWDYQTSKKKFCRLYRQNSFI